MITGPDGHRPMGPAPAGDFVTAFALVRDQVDHGLLTADGLIDAVRRLQGFLFNRLVPAECLDEVRMFLGHCESELVVRQRESRTVT